MMFQTFKRSSSMSSVFSFFKVSHSWSSGAPVKEYLVALPLSEESLLQIAIQMLCGFYGEMVAPDQNGNLQWRPLHLPGVLGPKALAPLLQQLADLGSLLQELRSATALLEAVAPPFAPEPLLEALAQGLQEGTISGLTGLARTWDLWKSNLLSQEEGNEATEPVNAFGMCWQSMGLMLAEFLSQFVEELQQFEASAPDPDKPRTLMRLLQLTQPWFEAAEAVKNVLDTTLQTLHQRYRCTETETTDLQSRPKLGPSLAGLAAEELLSALSSCASSQGLIRSFSSCSGSAGRSSGQREREELLRDTISELWCGAARPLLRAAEQWGSVGELGSEFLSEAPRMVQLLPSCRSA